MERRDKFQFVGQIYAFELSNQGKPVILIGLDLNTNTVLYIQQFP